MPDNYMQHLLENSRSDRDMKSEESKCHAKIAKFVYAIIREQDKLDKIQKGCDTK